MRPQIVIWILLAVTIFSCQDAPTIQTGTKQPAAAGNAGNQQDNQATSPFSDLVPDYEENNRKNWQKPQEVINSLGPISNAVIADIGAGTGYFSLRLLPHAKQVIAVDIDNRMIDFLGQLKSDLDKEFGEKLEVRLATENDPNLKPGEIDIAFLSNTYTYIDDRIDYFRRLKSSFTPNGFLCIVDFKKKRIPVHPNQEDRMPLFEVENELIEAGYEILLTDDTTLPYQYIIEARPKRSE